MDFDPTKLVAATIVDKLHEFPAPVALDGLVEAMFQLAFIYYPDDPLKLVRTINSAAQHKILVGALEKGLIPHTELDKRTPSE